MPNSIQVWRRANGPNPAYEITISAERTRSSIRIWVAPPSNMAYAITTALFRITKTNLHQHFGSTNSEWGYLARNIKGSYIPNIGYLDYLSEERDGDAWSSTSVNTKLNQFCREVYLDAKERWGECEHCSLLGHDTDVSHEECDGCGNEQVAGTRSIYSVITGFIDEENVVEARYLCSACQNDPGSALSLMRCVHCRGWVSSRTIRMLNAENSDLLRPLACPSCYNGTVECSSCDRQVFRGLADSNNLCGTCVMVQRDEGTIRAWNFKPTFIFHPGRTQVEGKFYVGLEVEVSFNRNISDRQYDAKADWIRDLPRELVYVKSDSSVSNGWEVVTHPMMTEWALKFFPWEIFDGLKDLGARDTHQSTGTHAHINKNAFTTGHLWKFMQIHYRLPKFCQVAGGRPSSSYASFDTSDYLRQREEITYILKNKEEALTTFGRSVALNFGNRDTVEVRYMAGGSTSKLVKKNLEWIKALLEFSKEITINQVNKGVIDDAGYFLGWIYDHKDELPNLADWMARAIPSVQAMPEGNN